MCSLIVNKVSRVFFLIFSVNFSIRKLKKRTSNLGFWANKLEHYYLFLSSSTCDKASNSLVISSGSTVVLAALDSATFLLALSCSNSKVKDSGRGGLDMVILGVCSELGCLFSEDPLLKKYHKFK